MQNRHEDPCTNCPSRRSVLKTGLTGAALAVLPLGCMGKASPPDGPIAAGNVSAIAVGTLTIVDGNAVLGRDAGGLYAMSNVCTHQGCPMNVATGGHQGLVCNCHGSTFDANGAVTHGPANTPLPHYQVDVAADGSITIQGAVPVASTARTPVG